MINTLQAFETLIETVCMPMSANVHFHLNYLSLLFLCYLFALKFSSVQFISASRPSTKYFIRNTGTGKDGRSCHL